MVDRPIVAAERRRNFHSLDALRGVAAIAVVAFHYPELLAPIGFRGAYLAVDLFFLMSGVVIAHAYEPRFAAGLRAGPFLRGRLARLFPLFVTGVLVSIVSIAAGLAMGEPSRWTWPGLAAALPNLVFLPAPPIAGRSPELYPLDFPGWSLLYELLVNLVFALAWRRLRGWRLVVLVAAGAVAVGSVAAGMGRLDGGIYWDDVPAGLARVTFSFFAGVAMLRAARWGGAGRLARVPVPLILAAAALLLFVPVPDPWRPAYDAACVLLLFPALVWTAMHAEPRRGVKACTWLGMISYPLYALHIPAKLPVIAVARLLSGGYPLLRAPGIGLVAIAGLVGLSWLAAEQLEPPFRRAVERALGVGRPPRP